MMTDFGVLASVQSALTVYKTFFMDYLEQYFDDEDDSDDEIVGEKNNVPTRIKLFVDHTAVRFSNVEFQRHFRVSREAFEWVLGEISPLLRSKRESGRQTLEPKKQLLAVLWLLATPDSYRSVGCRFDLSKGTLSDSFIRVIKIINESLAARIIKWPTSRERQEIERELHKLAKINGAVGLIDGTYVPIKAPRQNATVYINRKCFFGITLQAICDHKRRFTDCFAGYPSSVSDARIFRNSYIAQDINAKMTDYFSPKQFIMGDKAYPVLKWCLPPYIERGNFTRRKKNFNTHHAKTRQIIERSFALLFGRFRRLKYLDMNRVDLIPATVIAACVFHNICLKYNDAFIEEYEEEGIIFLREQSDEGNFQNDTNQENNDEQRVQEGHDLREEIAASLPLIY